MSGHRHDRDLATGTSRETVYCVAFFEAALGAIALVAGAPLWALVIYSGIAYGLIYAIAAGEDHAETR